MKILDGLDPYVARKRQTGVGFERPEALILSFCKHIGNLDFADLRSSHLLSFLNNSQTSATTWRSKYHMLFRFLEFWFHRGAMAEVLMPPPKPPVRQTFVPYVYSRADLRALLKATVQSQGSRSSIDRQTFRTLILVLYGTGARVGEILSALRDDVNLKSKMFTISSGGSSRSRAIPIGADLQDVLCKYLNWRTQRNLRSPYLFVTKNDHRLPRGSTVANFQKLRRIAMVNRGEGKQQPRMDDLRYTFAVHRITSWIKKGADLDRMLPAMAAYMGQIGLGATERYLAMTPERLKKSLNKLSPVQSRNRWRNDRELINFLSSL